jgi:hypothetical protein
MMPKDLPTQIYRISISIRSTLPSGRLIHRADHSPLLELVTGAENANAEINAPDKRIF